MTEMTKKLKDKDTELSKLRTQLEESNLKIVAKKNKISQLRSRLEQLRLPNIQNLNINQNLNPQKRKRLDENYVQYIIHNISYKYFEKKLLINFLNNGGLIIEDKHDLFLPHEDGKYKGLAKLKLFTEREECILKNMDG